MNPKPAITLGMPADNEIYRQMEAALAFHGFDVHTFIFDSADFTYPSLSSRLYVKFRQILFRDKKVKHRLKLKTFYQKAMRQLERINGTDYALFVRGDLYSPEFLSAVRARSRHGTVNYQWDGMHRYPDIWERIGEFDRFFVFDPADAANPDYRFLPTTNFYFDHNLPQRQPENEYDFYFLGSHIPGRDADIAAFARFAKSKNWKLDFNIGIGTGNIAEHRAKYPEDNVRLFSRYVGFDENLAAVCRAKVLVDFKTPVHNGLSFRAFEALGHSKKLLTTNPEAARYDFYHPNNVFVWDGKSTDGIEEFFHTPYREPDPAVREKYSVGNWIRYMLDIPPYQPISLPPPAAESAAGR